MRAAPTLVVAVAAGVAGAIVDSGRGFLVGLALGALWGSLRATSVRLDRLEGAVRDLAARLDALDAAARGPVERPAPAAAPPYAAPEAAAPEAAAPPPLPPLQPPPQRALEELRAADRAAARAATSTEPGSFGSAVAALVEVCTTGNLVAKVGVVVLFFGVAFLVRFAAEAGLLPIEYRLIGVTAGALVMLALGGRLRRSRPDFATAVQGGAVGILYLTIFAAFRLYDLLPAAAALVLMLAVVALSGALAVWQNQMALAVLGTTGGFLAPVLASTGSGSHASLFSYYLVLNLGIVGLAWFRAWRLLNWLGFVFTFGIGLFWGDAFYEPALFGTAEPFLIAFFLFYVAVSVLFARRQPIDLRGYIDGTLVFALPAVAFAMQSRLVSDIPLGRAYSATVLSLFYLALARALWSSDQKQRPLAEAFLALGVVFLSLTIPLAFDGPAIAAAWALEGAALVWVGFRQERVLARTAGSLLLMGAGLAFLAGTTAIDSRLPVLNSRFLAGVAVAGGALLSSFHYFKGRASRAVWEGPIESVLLAWGLLWWIGTLAVEADRFALPARRLATLIAGTAITTAVVGAWARRLQWPALAWSAVPFAPFAAFGLVATYAGSSAAGPWTDLGWLSWPLALAASYAVLWWLEIVWPSSVVRAWHALTGWLAVFLATWAAAAVVNRIVPDAPVWAHVMWAAVPSAAVLALLSYGGRLTWPVQRLPDVYEAAVPAVPVAGALLWCVGALADSGEPTPLPYVPILNPLELTQGISLVTALHWSRLVWSDGLSRRWAARAGWFAAAIAFLALNAVVGRIVHVWFGVPYDFEMLTGTPIFQACVSVLWAATSLSLMTVASRQRIRTLWMVGALLLGALITKLFVIDLGTIGTVARIVSFLVTGLLIMAIGYLSPAPPRQENA